MPFMSWATHVLQWPVQRDAIPRGGANPPFGLNPLLFPPPLRGGCVSHFSGRTFTRDSGVSISRQEVFQPHLPIRLPCYDLTPVICLTFDSSSLPVRPLASGATNSHGLTGGVYKPRERIHRDMADSRLLAIPASKSRVADSYPN